MKRLLPLFLALALLAGCARPPQPVNGGKYAPPYEPAQEPEEEPFSTVYHPPEEPLTPEHLVYAYIEQLYLSYCHLTDIDLSAILVTDRSDIRGSVLWTSMLNQRRRLLLEHGLCYVETQMFPYHIEFLEDDELDDVRLEFWDPRDVLRGEDRYIHFTVVGEPGRAYPPQLAVGSQHTMILRKIDGAWRIRFHYFPGSLRKFISDDYFYMPSEEEMLAELVAEFSSTADTSPPSVPAGALRYNGDRAADYALRHTESANGEFYRIDDFMGNCANFTSQGIWTGFTYEDTPANFAAMTSEWYAGGGGGTPAWENVERFWSYITGGTHLVGQPLSGIAEVLPGDLIQTTPRIVVPGWEEDGEGGDDADRAFNHSLIVADAQTLLLGQNSPGCFVYYADLVNVDTRMIRPIYLME